MYLKFRLFLVILTKMKPIVVYVTTNFLTVPNLTGLIREDISLIKKTVGHGEMGKI